MKLTKCHFYVRRPTGTVGQFRYDSIRLNPISDDIELAELPIAGDLIVLTDATTNKTGLYTIVARQWTIAAYGSMAWKTQGISGDAGHFVDFVVTEAEDGLYPNETASVDTSDVGSTFRRWDQVCGLTGLTPEDTLHWVTRGDLHEFHMEPMHAAYRSALAVALVQTWREACGEALGIDGFVLSGSNFVWPNEYGDLPHRGDRAYESRYQSLLRTAVDRVDPFDLAEGWRFAPDTAQAWAQCLNAVTAQFDGDVEVMLRTAHKFGRVGGTDAHQVDLVQQSLTAKDRGWAAVYDPANRLWTATSLP